LESFEKISIALTITHLDEIHFLDILIIVKLLLCGMGNKNRGDDGFGPYIIEHVQESETITTIDSTLYLENYLTKIVSLSPHLIVFFDTVKNSDSKPVLLKNDEIVTHDSISLSTHTIPLSAVYQFLKQNSSAEIFFLGIPAHSYQEFSQETKDIADRICSVFNNVDREKNLDIINVYENLSAAIR
jgi:hydrogenase maturation protease